MDNLEDYGNKEFEIELEQTKFTVITDREGFIRDIPWKYHNFREQPFPLLKAFVFKQNPSVKIEVIDRG